MLESMLSNIENELKRKNLIDDDDIEILIEEYFRYLSENSYLRAGKIMEKIDCDVNLAYKIITEIESLGYVKPVYSLYCGNCRQEQTKEYEAFTDVPDEALCQTLDCDLELNSKNDLLILFKVMYSND